MLKRGFTKRFAGDERGATAIEYGLAAGMIALAAIGGMSAAGEGTKRPLNCAGETLQASSKGSSCH
ncbi:phosphoribosyl-AMP cyclohydrolase [Ahrensia sp. R2A130]|nr:phosphoribosyl-AMP cyclohydrolase [Ahrensia sp. R2A130]